MTVWPDVCDVNEVLSRTDACFVIASFSWLVEFPTDTIGGS
jgi:hypothetical protein